MPKMLADVVYTSSHSPLMHGALKLCGFGFNTSNALASASIASLSSSVAVTPRSTGSLARKSAALALSRASRAVSALARVPAPSSPPRPRRGPRRRGR